MASPRAATPSALGARRFLATGEPARAVARAFRARDTMCLASARSPALCREADMWAKKDAEALGANAKFLVENTKKCPNPGCGARSSRVSGCNKVV